MGDTRLFRGLRITALSSALALLGFSYFFSACSLLDPSPEATVTRVEEPSCDDLTLLSGEQIYRCECASCHGVDGVPATEEITDIRGFSASDKFEASLNNGPGSMPAYPEIAAAERERLFEYVRDNLGEE